MAKTTTNKELHISGDASSSATFRLLMFKGL